MELRESKNFIQHSYILMVGYFLSTIFSTIGTILIIRLISVEELSLINISYILPNILINLSELGLNYSSTHFIARRLTENNNRGVRNIIKINLYVKIFIGLAFTIYTAFFPLFIAKEIYNINDSRMIFLIQIASIGIISSILYEALNSFFLGTQNMKIVQFGSILRSSLRSGISVFLILLGYTLIGPSLGFVFSTLISVIFYFFFLIKIYPKKNGEKSPTNWSEFSLMFRYGYPLMISTFIAEIENELYFLILSNYGYISEVSYLTIAITGAALISIFKKAIAQSLFPIFSKKNWSELKERRSIINYYLISLKFETLIILPITLFIILFSGDVFSLVFGDPYRLAAPYISIHFLSYLLIPIGYITIPAFFNGQKLTRIVLFIEIITLISSIILSILLIPYFGGFAVFIGILLGKTISIIYGNIILYKKFGTELYSNLKIVLQIFLMVLFSGGITLIFYNIIIIFIPPFEWINNFLIIFISFIIFFGIFLFLTGIFLLISVEEIDLIVNSFDIIPVFKYVFPIIGKVEKSIVNIRSKKN